MIIRESQSLDPLLFLQDSDFLLKVIDDVLLLPVHPARKRDQCQFDQIHGQILAISSGEKHFQIPSAEHLQVIKRQQILL